MSRTGYERRDGPPPSADLGGPLRTVAVAFGVGVAGFVIGLALTFLLVNVLALAGLFGAETAGAVLLLVLIVPLQGVGFPLTVLGYLRWRDLPLSYLRIRRPTLRHLGIAVGGLVAVVLLVNVSVAAIDALGLTAAERGDQEFLTQPDVALVGIPLMLLLVGPGEELLFRGTIQTTLGEEFSTPVAIVGASLTFAPAHIGAYLGTGASAAAVAVSISVLFVPSLVFGAVYEYTDNLVVPALSHGLYNATILAVVLLGPGAASGTTDPGLVLAGL